MHVSFAQLSRAAAETAAEMSLVLLSMVFSAQTLVLHSAGNGGSPVYVVTSDVFDVRLPARVQTHYHGDQATALSGDHMPRIFELLGADSQRVFVLPEACGNVGASPTNWSNVTDQALTTSDALRELGEVSVVEYTVSAHSAGGRALASASRNARLQADRVVLLDCLYEPAATAIRDALLRSPVRDVVLVHGTNSPARISQFAATFGISPISLSDHAATVRYVLDGSPAS